MVKYHNFKTREIIRKLSYQKRETLKTKNIGIGVQLPFEIRDRKCYPSHHYRVKVVGDKLFVNGKLYTDHQPTPGSHGDPE